MRTDALAPTLEALEAIYAACQDPTRWNPTLERIAAAVGGVGATLGYADLTRVQDSPTTHTAFSISSVFDRAAMDYYDRVLAPTDPITPLIQDVPVGVAALSHEILDPRVWTQSRMYAEYYQPHMVLHAMAGAFAREHDRFGVVIVMQERGGRRFDRDRARLLEALFPHIDRAMQISRLLAATQAEGELGGKLAAAYLDERGQVLALGSRAEALLRECTRLALHEGRLRSRDAHVDAWLTSLGGVDLGDPLAVRARGLVARVDPCWLADGLVDVRLDALPCPDPLPSWTTPGPRPATIVLLEPRPRADGLPPSLAEIAELIADGLSDKEIAVRTGRPLATVRTYVARLYQRTGSGSRAALTKWWWTARRQPLG